MERIQPLSNYLPVKRNLKYPAFLFVAILFFISSYSCIEQFTPNINKGELQNLLVVEGQITDEEGPFRVKLSSTFEIDNMQLYGDPVYGAEVNIFDDKGNQFQLFYTVEGWYETEDRHLKGVVGNTYTLNISTEDGTQYESSPVMMLDVPEIERVYFEEATKTRFEDGKAYEENWLDILIDANDPAGQTKYWKWDFEETWEVDTPKDSVYVEIDPISGNITTISVSLDFLKGNIRRGWDNNKERCWVTKPSSSILIKSTSKRSVDEVVRFPVKSIGPDEDRLYIKYSILVKQSALSKETYKFWKELREANETTGSIYDKIPSQIYGNIRCCDGKGRALGYFSASAVKTKRIFISPYEHTVKTRCAYEGCGYYYPVRLPYYYFGTFTAVSNPKYKDLIGKEFWFDNEWCVDCRVYATDISGAGSGSKKPDFWED